MAIKKLPMNKNVDFNNKKNSEIDQLILEHVDKISPWYVIFNAKIKFLTCMNKFEVEVFRDHLQMFDQVLIEFDRKYSVKIN